MHPDHERVFARFLHYHIAIVGSSLRDMDAARDIDVLFPASQDFRRLARELGIPYKGGWNLPIGRMHQLVYRLGDLKPLNLIQCSSFDNFDQWRHVVLLRDGRRLHATEHYYKQEGMNDSDPDRRLHRTR